MFKRSLDYIAYMKKMILVGVCVCGHTVALSGTPFLGSSVLPFPRFLFFP